MRLSFLPRLDTGLLPVRPWSVAAAAPRAPAPDMSPAPAAALEVHRPATSTVRPLPPPLRVPGLDAADSGPRGGNFLSAAVAASQRVQTLDTAGAVQPPPLHVQAQLPATAKEVMRAPSASAAAIAPAASAPAAAPVDTTTLLLLLAAAAVVAYAVTR